MTKPLPLGRCPNPWAVHPENTQRRCVRILALEGAPRPGSGHSAQQFDPRGSSLCTPRDRATAGKHGRGMKKKVSFLPARCPLPPRPCSSRAAAGPSSTGRQEGGVFPPPPSSAASRSPVFGAAAASAEALCLPFRGHGDVSGRGAMKMGGWVRLPHPSLLAPGRDPPLPPPPERFPAPTWLHAWFLGEETEQLKLGNALAFFFFLFFARYFFPHGLRPIASRN